MQHSEMRHKLKGNNYPSEIRETFKEKRKARKMWQKSRSASDKNILNNLSQRLRCEIAELKQNSFNIYLKELTNEKSTDYSLWEATNRPIVQIPPLKTS